MNGRTDRILAAIIAEIERHRESIDRDGCLQKLVITAKMNDGGYVRGIWIERESFTDLSALPRRPVTSSLTAV